MHVPNDAHFRPLPQLFLIRLLCLFVCWIQGHVCTAPSRFCCRAPCTQRLCFIACPTPLYCSCQTALLQQTDREGQRDEGRAGWTLSHLTAHALVCWFTTLINTGLHNRAPLAFYLHGLPRHSSTAITSLPKGRHREHGAVALLPCSPSRLHHIPA